MFQDNGKGKQVIQTMGKKDWSLRSKKATLYTTQNIFAGVNLRKIMLDPSLPYLYVPNRDWDTIYP